MASIKIKGTVEMVGDIDQITPKMQKRLLRIQEMDAKYPQTYDLEAINDRVDLMENLKEGDEVMAYCNIKGRLWEKGNKVFVSLELWKIDALTQDTHHSEPSSDIAPKALDKDARDDDVPF